MSARTTTRFAPSPTGLLHLGHAVSALFAYERGQSFILRLEDIDQTRCRAEFETAIYEDLTWLGLKWPTPVRKQSEHFAAYRAVLHKLQEQELIYPCFCTRKEIEAEIARSPSAPHGPEGALYPGTCKHLSAAERTDKMARGMSYALRLDTTEACKRSGPLTWFDQAKGHQLARPEICGDVVLARKDTPASYHLCVTHDDALQNITLVTRGEDLFFATHIHRLLQAVLDYPVPEYHHHPLITGPDGRKFSKRDHSLTLREIRNKGFAGEDLAGIIRDNKLRNFLENIT